MRNKLSLLVNFVGVDKLSGSLKSIITNGKEGSKSLKAMRKEAVELEKQLRDVKDQLVSAPVTKNGLLLAERELKAAIEDTNRLIKQREGLLAIEGNRSSMAARGAELRSKGQDNMMGGAAMLAPFAMLSKAGMDYEKQLALLAQKTDLNKDETKQFGDALLRTARMTKQMPDTIIEGADFLASKGLGVEALKKAMPAIGEFSTAWDAGVLDSSKAAYANMLSLKVPATQTARALEIMGMAGKEGGFEVRDMAQHFPILTSQLAVLGGKGLPAVSSLSAALQILEGKTGDGAVAANDLGNLMNFVNTKQGIANFKKFGINITDSLRQAVKDGRDPLETLAQLIQKATGGDSARIAQLVTDQQAGRAALNLATEIEQYRNIRDAAYQSQGMTAQEFERMSNTSAANWEAAKGSLAGLSAILGTHALPLMTKGVDTITRFTNRVAEWATANPETAKTLLTVVGGLGAFRIGLGLAQFALGSLFGPLSTGIALWKKYKLLGSLAATFPKVAKAFSIVRSAATLMGSGFMKAGSLVRSAAMLMGGGLMKAFTIMRSAAMMLGSGLMKAGAMMLANPMVLTIGAIVIAVGLLAYGIYKNWDAIKAGFNAGLAWLSSAWVTFKGYFAAGVDYVASLPSRMLQMGKDIINGLVNGILSAPEAVWNALKSIVMRGITGVQNLLQIKSPSRVFMAIGAHTSEGLARGIEGRGSRATGAMSRLAAGVTAAGSLALAPVAAQAIAPPFASSAASRSAQSGSTFNVTINIQQLPGQSSQDLARDIRRELEGLNAIASRRSYEDRD